MPCIATTAVDVALVDVMTVLTRAFKALVAVAVVAPDSVCAGPVSVTVVRALLCVSATANIKRGTL